jgi:hypothetical protein
LECLGRKPQTITHLYSLPGDWPEHFRRVDQHDAADLRIKEMFKRLRDGRLKSRPRIRRGLARLDYTRETYTRLLWLYEGFTDYLAHVIVLRAGITRERDFLRMIAEDWPKYAGRPGRNEFTLPCPLVRTLRRRWPWVDIAVIYHNDVISSGIDTMIHPLFTLYLTLTAIFLPRVAPCHLGPQASPRRPNDAAPAV